MQARRQEPLSRQIERQILKDAGLFVVVEESTDGIRLSGLVDSPGDSQAAEDIARTIAVGRPVYNDLEVEQIWPSDVSDVTPIHDVTPEHSGWAESLENLTEGGALEPDFSDQPISSDPVSAPGPSDSLGDVVSDGNVVYFPPTDPVIQVDDDADAEVLGGFSPTSSDEIEVERSALDGRPGDEALADAIRRELRQDASTTDLQVEVSVLNGVARLTGRVPDLQDAENAESVARTVPGIVDVDESLEVTEL